MKTKPNFSLTRKCFPLTGKCFPLTNFSNDKQTQESLKSGFSKSEFEKQTWLKVHGLVRFDNLNEWKYTNKDCSH